MAEKLKKGDDVTWKWGRGEAEGTVTAVFDKPVEHTIKGKRIKRNASPEKPAVEIRQEDGDRVLKSSTEVHKG
jgi:hypothetical protein